MLKKKQGFDQSFMVYDALKAHKLDKVKVLLSTNNTNFALVPADGTSRCQPLHVSINKPFKGALSDLKQFLANESPLKIMKKAFYFTLKDLFVLKIFKFFVLTFWLCIKRLD